MTLDRDAVLRAREDGAAPPVVDRGGGDAERVGEAGGSAALRIAPSVQRHGGGGSVHGEIWLANYNPNVN